MPDSTVESTDVEVEMITSSSTTPSRSNDDIPSGGSNDELDMGASSSESTSRSNGNIPAGSDNELDMGANCSEFTSRSNGNIPAGSNDELDMGASSSEFTSRSNGNIPAGSDVELNMLANSFGTPSRSSGHAPAGGSEVTVPFLTDSDCRSSSMCILPDDDVSMSDYSVSDSVVNHSEHASCEKAQTGASLGRCLSGALPVSDDRKPPHTATGGVLSVPGGVTGREKVGSPEAIPEDSEEGNDRSSVPEDSEVGSTGSPVPEETKVASSCAIAVARGSRAGVCRQFGDERVNDHVTSELSVDSDGTRLDFVSAAARQHPIGDLSLSDRSCADLAMASSEASDVSERHMASCDPLNVNAGTDRSVLGTGVGSPSVSVGFDSVPAIIGRSVEQCDDSISRFSVSSDDPLNEETNGCEVEMMQSSVLITGDVSRDDISEERDEDCSLRLNTSYESIDSELGQSEPLSKHSQRFVSDSNDARSYSGVDISVLTTRPLLVQKAFYYWQRSSEAVDVAERFGVSEGCLQELVAVCSSEQLTAFLRHWESTGHLMDYSVRGDSSERLDIKEHALTEDSAREVTDERSKANISPERLQNGVGESVPGNVDHGEDSGDHSCSTYTRNSHEQDNNELVNCSGSRFDEIEKLISPVEIGSTRENEMKISGVDLVSTGDQRSVTGRSSRSHSRAAHRTAPVPASTSCSNPVKNAQDPLKTSHPTVDISSITKCSLATQQALYRYATSKKGYQVWASKFNVCEIRLRQLTAESSRQQLSVFVEYWRCNGDRLLDEVLSLESDRRCSLEAHGGDEGCASSHIDCCCPARKRKARSERSRIGSIAERLGRDTPGAKILRNSKDLASNGDKTNNNNKNNDSIIDDKDDKSKEKMTDVNDNTSKTSNNLSATGRDMSRNRGRKSSGAVVEQEENTSSEGSKSVSLCVSEVDPRKYVYALKMIRGHKSRQTVIARSGLTSCCVELILSLSRQHLSENKIGVHCMLADMFGDGSVGHRAVCDVVRRKLGAQSVARKYGIALGDLTASVAAYKRALSVFNEAFQEWYGGRRKSIIGTGETASLSAGVTKSRSRSLSVSRDLSLSLNSDISGGGQKSSDVTPSKRSTLNRMCKHDLGYSVYQKKFAEIPKRALSVERSSESRASDTAMPKARSSVNPHVNIEQTIEDASANILPVKTRRSIVKNVSNSESVSVSISDIATSADLSVINDTNPTVEKSLMKKELAAVKGGSFVSEEGSNVPGKKCVHVDDNNITKTLGNKRKTRSNINVAGSSVERIYGGEKTSGTVRLSESAKKVSDNEEMLPDSIQTSSSKKLPGSSKKLHDSGKTSSDKLSDKYKLSKSDNPSSSITIAATSSEVPPGDQVSNYTDSDPADQPGRRSSSGRVVRPSGRLVAALHSCSSQDAVWRVFARSSANWGAEGHVETPGYVERVLTPLKADSTSTRSSVDARIVNKLSISVESAVGGEDKGLVRVDKDRDAVREEDEELVREDKDKDAVRVENEDLVRREEDEEAIQQDEDEDQDVDAIRDEDEDAVLEQDEDSVRELADRAERAARGAQACIRGRMSRQQACSAHRVSPAELQEALRAIAAVSESVDILTEAGTQKAVIDAAVAVIKGAPIVTVRNVHKVSSECLSQAFTILHRKRLIPNYLAYYCRTHSEDTVSPDDTVKVEPRHSADNDVRCVTVKGCEYRLRSSYLSASNRHRVEEIIITRLSGASYAELKRRFGVSSFYVAHHLRRMLSLPAVGKISDLLRGECSSSSAGGGIPRLASAARSPGDRSLNARLRKAVRARLAGQSYAEIRTNYKLPPELVHRHVLLAREKHEEVVPVPLSSFPPETEHTENTQTPTSQTLNSQKHQSDSSKSPDESTETSTGVNSLEPSPKRLRTSQAAPSPMVRGRKIPAERVSEIRAAVKARRSGVSSIDVQRRYNITPGTLYYHMTHGIGSSKHHLNTDSKAMAEPNDVSQSRDYIAGSVSQSRDYANGDVGQSRDYTNGDVSQPCDSTDGDNSDSCDYTVNDVSQSRDFTNGDVSQSRDRTVSAGVSEIGRRILRALSDIKQRPSRGCVKWAARRHGVNHLTLTYYLKRQRQGRPLFRTGSAEVSGSTEQAGSEKKCRERVDGGSLDNDGEEVLLNALRDFVHGGVTRAEAAKKFGVSTLLLAAAEWRLARNRSLCPSAIPSLQEYASVLQHCASRIARNAEKGVSSFAFSKTCQVPLFVLQRVMDEESTCGNSVRYSMDDSVAVVADNEIKRRKSRLKCARNLSRALSLSEAPTANAECVDVDTSTEVFVADDVSAADLSEPMKLAIGDVLLGKMKLRRAALLRDVNAQCLRRLCRCVSARYGNNGQLVIRKLPAANSRRSVGTLALEKPPEGTSTLEKRSGGILARENARVPPQRGSDVKFVSPVPRRGGLDREAALCEAAREYRRGASAKYLAMAFKLKMSDIVQAASELDLAVSSGNNFAGFRQINSTSDYCANRLEEFSAETMRQDSPGASDKDVPSASNSSASSSCLGEPAETRDVSCQDGSGHAVSVGDTAMTQCVDDVTANRYQDCTLLREAVERVVLLQEDVDDVIQEDEATAADRLVLLRESEIRGAGAAIRVADELFVVYSTLSVISEGWSVNFTSLLWLFKRFYECGGGYLSIDGRDFDLATFYRTWPELAGEISEEPGEPTCRFKAAFDRALFRVCDEYQRKTGRNLPLTSLDFSPSTNAAPPVKEGRVVSRKEHAAADKEATAISLEREKSSLDPVLNRCVDNSRSGRRDGLAEDTVSPTNNNRDNDIPAHSTLQLARPSSPVQETSRRSTAPVAQFIDPGVLEASADDPGVTLALSDQNRRFRSDRHFGRDKRGRFSLGRCGRRSGKVSSAARSLSRKVQRRHRRRSDCRNGSSLTEDSVRRNDEGKSAMERGERRVGGRQKRLPARLQDAELLSLESSDSSLDAWTDGHASASDELQDPLPPLPRPITFDDVIHLKPTVAVTPVRQLSSETKMADDVNAPQSKLVDGPTVPARREINGELEVIDSLTCESEVATGPSTESTRVSKSKIASSMDMTGQCEVSSVAINGRFHDEKVYDISEVMYPMSDSLVSDGLIVGGNAMSMLSVDGESLVGGESSVTLLSEDASVVLLEPGPLIVGGPKSVPTSRARVLPAQKRRAKIAPGFPRKQKASSTTTAKTPQVHGKTHNSREIETTVEEIESTSTPKGVSLTSPSKPSVDKQQNPAKPAVSRMIMAKKRGRPRKQPLLQPDQTSSSTKTPAAVTPSTGKTSKISTADLSLNSNDSVGSNSEQSEQTKTEPPQSKRARSNARPPSPDHVPLRTSQSGAAQGGTGPEAAEEVTVDLSSCLAEADCSEDVGYFDVNGEFIERPTLVIGQADWLCSVQY